MLKVLLWKGPWSNLASAFIRIWTQSDYSHSALELDGEVWEFTRWGFRRTPLEDYASGWDLWQFEGLTEEQHTLMLHRMSEISDNPGINRYDWSALIGLGLQSLFQILCGRNCETHPEVNPFHHPDRYFCSEFVADVAAAAGYQHDKSPSLVYPVDHTKVPWLRREVK